MKYVCYKSLKNLLTTLSLLVALIAIQSSSAFASNEQSFSGSDRELFHLLQEKLLASEPNVTSSAPCPRGTGYFPHCYNVLNRGMYVGMGVSTDGSNTARPTLTKFCQLLGYDTFKPGSGKYSTYSSYNDELIVKLNPSNGKWEKASTNAFWTGFTCMNTTSTDTPSSDISNTNCNDTRDNDDDGYVDSQDAGCQGDCGITYYCGDSTTDGTMSDGNEKAQEVTYTSVYNVTNDGEVTLEMLNDDVSFVLKRVEDGKAVVIGMCNEWVDEVGTNLAPVPTNLAAAKSITKNGAINAAVVYDRDGNQQIFFPVDGSITCPQAARSDTAAGKATIAQRTVKVKKGDTIYINTRHEKKPAQREHNGISFRKTCSTSPCDENKAYTSSETDNGKEYYKQGTTSYTKDGKTTQVTDECVNTQRLAEYYATTTPKFDSNDKPIEGRGLVYYNCPYGCYEGACKHECETNDDCTNSAKPVCNPSSLTCEACPSGKVYNTTTKTCTECVTNDNCPSSKPVCNSSYTCEACPSGKIYNSTTKTCTECLTNANCPSTKPVCNSSYSCEACPSGKVYNNGTQSCTECITNANCPSSKPVCNSSYTCESCPSGKVYNNVTKTCTECITNANCPSSKPVCNQNSYTCEACPSGKVYNTTTKTCTECVTNANCPSSKPVCNQNSYTCEACPSGKVYNTTTKTCTECVTDANCPSSKPVCNSSYTCEACPSGKVYDSASNTCVQCTTDDTSNCQSGQTCTNNTCTDVYTCSKSNHKVTRKVNGKAVETQTDSCTGRNKITYKCADDKKSILKSAIICQYGCSSDGYTCKDVECDENDDSNCVGETPVCDIDTNTCVECLVNSDCTDPLNPVCNQDTNTCEPCEDGTVYDSSTEQCVECTEDDLSQCEDGQVCSNNTCQDKYTCSKNGIVTKRYKNGKLAETRQDNCSGSTQNIYKCSSDNKSIINNPNTCRYGCSSNGLTCNSVECTTSEDCTNPDKPKCENNSCVACQDGTFYNEATDSCVECTTDNLSNCAAGQACVNFTCQDVYTCSKSNNKVTRKVNGVVAETQTDSCSNRTKDTYKCSNDNKSIIKSSSTCQFRCSEDGINCDSNECNTSADCLDPSKPKCENHSCVNCPKGTSYNEATDSCVQCTINDLTNCEPGQICSNNTCTDVYDCEDFDGENVAIRYINGKVVETKRGSCKGSTLTTYHCADDKKSINTFTTTCQYRCSTDGKTCDDNECNTSDDCTNPDKPKCENHSCQACPNGTIYNEATDSCVECTSNADCQDGYKCVENTCVPKTECEDGIDNDGDGLKDSNDPGCQNCEGTACSETQGYTSSETDGGDDPDNRGTTTYTKGNGTPKKFTDTCQNSTTLIEYVATNTPKFGSDGKPVENRGRVTHTCQYGCLDGACQPECKVDSDCESNEKCVNNTCVEKGECEDGIDNDGDGLKDSNDPGCQNCEGTACSETQGYTSSETDSGDDPDNKGTTTYTKGNGTPKKFTDTCQNSTTLIEYVATNTPKFGKDGKPVENRGRKTHDCEYGCLDGACQPECKVDSDCENGEKCVEHQCVQKGECEDGIDNDGDGLKDSNDPGCQNCEGTACSETQGYTSSETDGGDDPDNKGTTTYTKGNGTPKDFTDVCADSKTLIEYVATNTPKFGKDGKPVENRGRKTHTCDYACENGACKPECSVDSDCESGEKCVENQCVQKGECEDGIDNDGDGLKDSNDPGCQNCEGTACSETQGYTSSETDNGDDPDNKGTTTYTKGNGTPQNFTDTCQNSTTLIEYVATTTPKFGKDGNPVENRGRKTHNCEYGCLDGACQPECTVDSDCENGEKCVEHQCVQKGECEDGIDNDGDGLKDSNDPGCQNCEGDSCKETQDYTSSETDSGDDPENKGTTTYTKGNGTPKNFTDVCADSDTLIEYVATTTPKFGKDGNPVENKGRKTHTCQYGCQDGACISTECEGNYGTDTRPCTSIDKPVCSDEGKCVACESGVYDTTTKTCVECLESSSCPEDEPICNPESKTCVECLDDTNCPTDKPVCNQTTNACEACPNGGVYNTETKSCVECLTDSNCPNDKPVCDTTNNTCVECLEDTNCPTDKPVCNQTTNTCEACPNGGVYNTETKSCVECVTDSNCPDDKPVCDTENNTCEQCVTDENCSETQKCEENVCVDKYKAITPILDCIMDNEDGTYSAYFGYENTNDEVITIKAYDDANSTTDVNDTIGGANYAVIVGPGYVKSYGKQISTFKVGRVKGAFSIPFKQSEKIRWRLKTNSFETKEETADASSVKCAKVTPAAKCISINADGSLQAYFGYTNNNDFEVTIPVGARNNINPDPEDRGQPVQFLPGNVANVFDTKLDEPSTAWYLDGVSVSADKTLPTCTVNNKPTCEEAGKLAYNTDCQGTATTLDLDATGCVDPDGTKLSYSWETDCEDALLTNENTANATLQLTIPGTGVAQTCTVKVTVTDGLETASATQNVNVTACNVDCPGTDDQKDQCGVCGGDGTSCLDCAGVPFGDAKLDKCDKCNGNNECLDCFGVPYGPAKEDRCGICGGDGSTCIQCTETSIKGDKAKIHGDEFVKMLKQQTELLLKESKPYPPIREIQSSADRRINRAEKKNAQIKSYVLKLSDVIKSCTDTEFCTQGDNEPTLEVIARYLRKLRRQVGRTIRQRNINNQTTNKLLNQNTKILNEKLAILAKIPRFYSECE